MCVSAIITQAKGSHIICGSRGVNYPSCLNRCNWDFFDEEFCANRSYPSWSRNLVLTSFPLSLSLCFLFAQLLSNFSERERIIWRGLPHSLPPSLPAPSLCCLGNEMDPLSTVIAFPNRPRGCRVDRWLGNRYKMFLF